MSLEELLQVVVTTASKQEESIFDAPGVVEIITSRDIEDFGAQNLQEVLDRATGVIAMGTYINPHGTTVMRGDATSLDSHVLLLIDGRPFRDSATGGQTFPLYTSFPLQMIERIEIVRGPGSVLYGSNAYSGVINLITKTAKRPHAGAALQYGSFRTAQGNASAGYIWKDLQVYAAAKYLRTRGWRLGLTDGRGTSDSILARERNLGITAGARYKDLSLTAFFAQSQQYSLGSDFSWPAVTIEGDKLFSNLGYTHKFGSRWAANANLTYNLTRNRAPEVPVPPPFAGNNPFISIPSQDALAELSVRGQLLDSLEILVGGSADYQTGGLISGPLPPPGQGLDLELSVLRPYDRVWWSGYGQLEYQPTSFLKLVVGGQLNKPNRVSAAFVPRLASIVHFTPRWGAKLMYGQAFRSAYAFETTVELPRHLSGNPELTPERVGTADVQMFYNTQRFQGAVTYFNTRQRNLITTVVGPTTGTGSYVNQDKREFQGLELEAKYFPVMEVQLTASYSLQTNEGPLGIKNYSLMPNHALKVGTA
ncbi:MAG TPA: TonB-dependent receptor, partial [Myxococcaceae bacterium]|nr:TonB-dependent receptor [Myxococcaceae bacterium]